MKNNNRTIIARPKGNRLPLHQLRKDLSNYKYLLVMLLPAIIYTLLFSYLPMTGIVVAFKDFNYRDGIYGSPWNGLDNFRFLILSNKLWPLTRNTLLYNLMFICCGMVFEVGFAILLNVLVSKLFAKVAQSLMFLPYFISWVVVASMIQAFFSYENGILSNLAVSLGFDRTNIYAAPKIWPFLLAFLDRFKYTGYGSVVYLAAITGLDQEMFEAAELDGANVWQRIRYVTLPSLFPTMVVMFLMALGRVFRGDFGMFYQTIGNNGMLLETADVLDLFIYRAMMASNDVGMSAAAGFYQSVLCFVTIVTVNTIIKKINPDYTLF